MLHMVYWPVFKVFAWDQGFQVEVAGRAAFRNVRKETISLVHVDFRSECMVLEVQLPTGTEFWTLSYAEA